MKSPGSEYNPFAFRFAPPDGKGPLQLAQRLLAPPIEYLFGLREFNNLRKSVYRKLNLAPPSNTSECQISVLDVVKEVHQEMNVTWDVHGSSLDRIPREGPVILVANHPFGGIEATVLLEILLSIRPDVRFMANFMLRRLPETEEFCIFVDPFARSQSTKLNLQPIRECINWVKHGGLLCIFPSGAVSHLQTKTREVSDPPWSPTVGRIIRKADCPVVPIYIRGRNDWLFQAAGLIHPLLRTALLPREFLNKRNEKIHLIIGNTVPTEKIQTYSSDEELMTYLRLRTYILGNTNHTPQHLALQLGEESLEEPPSEPAPAPRTETPLKDTRDLEPIAPEIPREILEQEILALDPRHLLVDSGDMRVYCSRAKQVPSVIQEIGRLREITFRAVEEGTGKPTDLDRFDYYYLHLFIWNTKKKEIVGAYRLGRTDQILRHFGRNGLYTSTLFAYRPNLLEQIGPALEVGRSFVRQEYQRSYTPLLLLWRGIGTYVVHHPRYRVLFGPVSINSDYDSISRQLITAFLKANNCLPHFAKLIRARNPMPRTRVMGMDPETTSVVVKDLREVSQLLKEIESRQEHVPVLLKQYLKLGGRLIGFNLDPSFGDVLDGLIYVDLIETEPRMLERYMGPDGIRSFYAFQNRPFPGDAAQQDSSKNVSTGGNEARILEKHQENL